MCGMVAYPAFALDQERHPRRCPRAALVPQRFRPTPQHALDPPQLGRTQLRLAPGTPRSIQRLQSAKATAGLAFVCHGRSLLISCQLALAEGELGQGTERPRYPLAFAGDGMESARKVPCPRAKMKVRGLAGLLPCVQRGRSMVKPGFCRSLPNLSPCLSRAITGGTLFQHPISASYGPRRQKRRDAKDCSSMTCADLPSEI